MFLTTGKMVKLSREMNRLSEEIDVALSTNTRAQDVLKGPLYGRLNTLQQTLRPLA